MRVLALDTALEACAVAVLDGPDLVASESEPMQRGHAEALVPMIERVAARAGGLETIDRIAVTVGPGSFTGLRVAIAAARGLALALRVPCVGVTTLRAIAAPFVDDAEGRPVAAVIDARHGHLYFELIGPRSTLVEARVLPVREAVRLLGSGTRLAGPGAPILARDAALAGVPFTIADAGPAPAIAAVARLAQIADPGTATPRPLYLKAADVTPQTAGKVPRA